MYTSLHNHTAVGSNSRGFLDSTNRVEEMIDYAMELGLNGIAFTDHDALTCHIDALHYLDSKRAKEPDRWNKFHVLCGNEIYLTTKQDIEEKNYRALYHFILIAKDEIGYRQMSELSTRAWCDNSFVYVNRRTPTSIDDLIEVTSSNPGHIIGTTACLGGQCDKMILSACAEDPLKPDYSEVSKWLLDMQAILGKDNFYLELQPSYQEDQIIVNKAILDLSKRLDIPYIVTTDSHYLKKEDRYIHEAFLRSDDNGDSREVGEFYSTTYLMSSEEVHQYLDEYIGRENVEQAFVNTNLILNACAEYSLDKPLEIPYKAFNDSEPDPKLYEKFVKYVPLLEYFFNSKHDCDRHLCREILNKFVERPEEFQNQETYKALHDCLDAIITSSEAQHTQWSGYLLVCKELIKTVWESGSLCGPGRGSGVGFFLLYMLDITQINPLREETQTYFWRFLHSQRASVLDIDFDSEGNKKDAIIENIRKKYGGYRHVTKVQTISTAKAKKAIQIAARALGYPVQIAKELSAHIKEERGIQYTLTQTYLGDAENNIAPDKVFVDLMNKEYPDIWKVALSIEGLPVGVGAHAGGLILSVNELPMSCPLMRTPSGDIITQVDLHKAENMGQMWAQQHLIISSIRLYKQSNRK